MSVSPLAFDTAVAPTTASTSAAGNFASGPVLSVIIVSGALAIPGTSSAEPRLSWEAHDERTSSGPSSSSSEISAEHSAEVSARAISELRRISGLTWDQLGQLFEVSRRSVHFWASGKAMNAANLKRLMRALEVVRAADRGDARSNRAALFERTDNVAPFDLLVEQRYEEAAALLGSGRGRRKVANVELDAASRAARMPPPPADLVDARHDRVHREVGRARAARTVRNKRREPGR
jgi:DNA-binding transcriptional regulator YiaG